MDGYTLPQIEYLLKVRESELARQDERAMLVANLAQADKESATEFLENLRDTAYGPKVASIEDAMAQMIRAWGST